jgi:predicted transcriptional regulator
MLTVDVVGGLWLIVLGGFLATAANAELQHSLLANALAGVHVRDVMVTQPLTVDGDWTLDELVAAIEPQTTYTAYPVVEGGEVVGLLPLAAVLTTPRRAWRERRVRDDMIPIAVAPTVEDDALVTDALESPGVARLGRALVRHGLLVVGLLSVTDVDRRLRSATR